MLIRYLVIVIVVSVLIALVIITYLLNKRTPRPDGCQEASGCHGCNVTTCSQYPIKEEK